MCLLQVVVVQIVGVVFEQCIVVIYFQCGVYVWQIVVVKLVLQCVGIGGDDGFQFGQQGWYQVGVGFVGVGIGFGQQYVVLVEGFGDGCGQVQLCWVWYEGIKLVGKCIVFVEGVVVGSGKVGYCFMIIFGCYCVLDCCCGVGFCFVVFGQMLLGRVWYCWVEFGIM